MIRKKSSVPVAASLDIRHLLIASAMSALTACATGAPSARACQAIDLAERGYADGSAGKPVNGLSRLIADCPLLASESSKVAYMSGHAQGTRVFCTPSSLRQFGRDGGEYIGQCSGLPGETQTVQAYEEGALIYSNSSPARFAETRIRAAEREKANLSSSFWSAVENPNGTSREEMLDLWSRKNWIKTVVIPHWENIKRSANLSDDDLEMRIARGDPEVWSASPAGALREPPAYRGPSRSDEQNMMREIIDRARVRAIINAETKE